MPKIRDSAYYDDAGGYRRAALDDKLAFFIQHPVWEGHPEYFMKNGSPKELYAISGMTIENMLRLAGMGQQAMNVTEGFKEPLNKSPSFSAERENRRLPLGSSDSVGK